MITHAEGGTPQRAYDFAHFLIKLLSRLKGAFDYHDDSEVQEMINILKEATKRELSERQK